MYEHAPKNHFDECQREELDDIFLDDYDDENDDLEDVDEDADDSLDDFNVEEERERLGIAKGLHNIQTEVEKENNEHKLREIAIHSERLNLGEYEYNNRVLQVYESRANLLLKLNFITRLRAEILRKKSVLFKIFRDKEPCLCLQKMLHSSAVFGLFLLKTCKDLQAILKVKAKDQEKMEMIEPYNEAMNLLRNTLEYHRSLDETDEMDSDSDSDEDSFSESSCNNNDQNHI